MVSLQMSGMLGMVKHRNQPRRRRLTWADQARSVRGGEGPVGSTMMRTSNEKRGTEIEGEVRRMDVRIDAADIPIPFVRRGGK